jgi:colanic acid biosynthesis glycosyl transferase WcaI
MRVHVISPVFLPEPIVSAQTTLQIAQALAERNHDVTVITSFPNRPAGRLYPGYRRTLYRCERARGTTCSAVALLYRLNHAY